jgi:hypothetical protein
VRLAARGTRDDDRCEVPIVDARERSALQAQARAVRVRACALAVTGSVAALGLRLVLASVR